MVKNKNMGFAEELKKLCRRHKVSAMVSCVCKMEDKKHGVHRMIMYGQREHITEIMGDMQDMFIEIGIGKTNKVETPYIQ